MARRRFFVEQVRLGEAHLSGEQAWHLSRVLRVEPGQRFEISDNQRVYLAEVASARKDRVVFSLIEEIQPSPPPVRLTLLASLIKFDRFEWILEKATELGVERVLPVVAARGEKGLDKAAEKRLARWRRIVLESSQQARRDRLPLLDAPLAFRQAAALDSKHRFLLEEASGAPPVLSALPPSAGRCSSDTVPLLIGPEGGWADDERQHATAVGWLPVSLGPLVLRAETAALAALAVLSSAWQAVR